MLLHVVGALQLGQQPLGSASLAIEAGGAGALQHSSTAVARPSTGAGRPAAGAPRPASTRAASHRPAQQSISIYMYFNLGIRAKLKYM